MRVPKRGTTPYKELCGHEHIPSPLSLRTSLFSEFFFYYLFFDYVFRVPGPNLFRVPIEKLLYKRLLVYFFVCINSMVISPNDNYAFPENKQSLIMQTLRKRFNFSEWTASDILQNFFHATKDIDARPIKTLHIFFVRESKTTHHP